MVDEPTELVVLSAGLVAGWKRVWYEGMVDELTVLVRVWVVDVPTELVVLSADLVEVAGWKRV